MNAEVDNVVKTSTFFLGSSMSSTAQSVLTGIASTADYNGAKQFTQIMDSGDLITPMASYFEPFSRQMDKSATRWVKYQDYSTGKTLYAACATMIKTADPEPDMHKKPVLGVVCMDMNLVVPIETVRTDTVGYVTFLRNIENTARKCAGAASPPPDLADGTCADSYGEMMVVAPGETATGGCIRKGNLLQLLPALALIITTLFM
jgi:hypothetical protein